MLSALIEVCSIAIQMVSYKCIWHRRKVKEDYRGHI